MLSRLVDQQELRLASLNLSLILFIQAISSGPHSPPVARMFLSGSNAQEVARTLHKSQCHPRRAAS